MYTRIKNNFAKRHTASRAAQHHIIQFIGNTPLIELKNISRQVAPVKIYAKAEWFNPGGSIKDRAALSIILNAIRRGDLTPDKTVLDATSGNTGIAYAMIGAALGYKVKLCTPANAGVMHKQMMLAYGAELVFTDPMSGTDGAIEEAKKLQATAVQRYFYADQYNNADNWKAHYYGTAQEIITQTQGKLTHFVAGLGSSGTFMGSGRRIKKYNSNIKLISVQPDSPLHGMEGMKHMETAHVPGIYDPGLADENVAVSTEEAQEMVHELGRQEGILIGNSAGGAMAVALRTARQIASGIIVVISPDAAYKYMDQGFWKGYNNEN
jgi:cysteine synthase B